MWECFCVYVCNLFELLYSLYYIVPYFHFRISFSYFVLAVFLFCKCVCLAFVIVFVFLESVVHVPLKKWKKKLANLAFFTKWPFCTPPVTPLVEGSLKCSFVSNSVIKEIGFFISILIFKHFKKVPLYWKHLFGIRFRLVVTWYQCTVIWEICWA